MPLIRARGFRPGRVAAGDINHRTRNNKRSTTAKVLISSVESGIAVFLVEVFLQVAGGGLVGPCGFVVERRAGLLVGLGLLRISGVVGGRVAPPVAAADQAQASQ